ncbi:MAG: rhodanese-like domain-containing protein [Bacteroidota bacterium]|jgi:phage shock protein E
MGLFSSLFGKRESTDFKALFVEGAIILDVRTATEFNNGHIKNAKNIAVQDLLTQLSELNKNKPIITCCASGMRSASAEAILKKAGFNAYNGGGWQSLQNKLK